MRFLDGTVVIYKDKSVFVFGILVPLGSFVAWTEVALPTYLVYGHSQSW